MILKIYIRYQEIGPKKNLSRTESMIWNENENSDGTYIQFILQIQHMELINAKHCKYIGVWISYNKLELKKLNVAVKSKH